MYAALIVAAATLAGVVTLLPPGGGTPAARANGQPKTARPVRSDLPALPAPFTRLLTLVKPQSGEAQFEQVPWINILWEARIKAAAEGKPIFIWAAGGPPGAC
jgi:hypothetical protein